MDEIVFLKLEADERTFTTRYAREDDEWDRDDTYTEWTIHGVREVREHGDGYDFVAEKKQDVYYAVLEFYNTGDSFHRAENRMCEQYLGLTREAAEAVAKALTEFAEHAPDFKYSYEMQDPTTGKPLTFHLNCLGYFESLNAFEVVEVPVITRRPYTYGRW